jgi:hypothetical protein
MVRRIEHGKFDFIGFNANANTVDIIIKRAHQLKQRFPNITIMVGGPEAELNYKEFCTDDIDIVYYDNDERAECAAHDYIGKLSPGTRQPFSLGGKLTFDSANISTISSYDVFAREAYNPE